MFDSSRYEVRDRRFLVEERWAPAERHRCHPSVRLVARSVVGIDLRKLPVPSPPTYAVKVNLTRRARQGILDGMTLEPDTFHISKIEVPARSVEAPSGRSHGMTLYGIREEQPGQRWQALHDATRDSYHRWYLSEGDAARPDLRTCRRMLPTRCPSSFLCGSTSWSSRVVTRSPPGCSRCGTLRPSRPAVPRPRSVAGRPCSSVTTTMAWTSSSEWSTQPPSPADVFLAREIACGASWMA